MDKNGDGVLSAQELFDALKESGVEEAKLKELLIEVDSDNSGAIEYTEFIAASWEFQNNLRESIVWGVFKLFDADDSGSVTKKEILDHLSSDQNSMHSLEEQF